MTLAEVHVKWSVVYALVCITNLQAHIVTCHVKNSIPFSQFLRLRRLCSDNSDFFHKSKSMCIFSKSVVILFLSFKRVTTARNLLIDSHHYKGHNPTAFHSLSRFTLTTTQLNPLFLKTSNYSKTIQRLVLSSRNLHSFHSNATKTDNFLIRSSFQTNDQPGTFECACARCKTCPFIHNANKISGPKRSIKFIFQIGTLNPTGINERFSFY